MDRNELKKFMAQSLADGMSLSDVQNAIKEQFGIKMTFMEVRVLAAELEDVDWGKQDTPAPEAEPEDAADAAETPAAAPAGDGATAVEISPLVRPGMAISGSVRFASGATAEWFVDQTGRFGLDKVNGEPTEDDIRKVQMELQRQLGRR